MGSIHFNGYEYGRKIKEKAKDLYYKKYIDEKKSKIIQTDGKIYHFLRSEESILSKDYTT